MSNVIVTGAANGLGKAIATGMIVAGHNMFGYDIEFGQDILKPYIPENFKLENEARIPLDILVNCAGINDIDWLHAFDEDRWDSVMDTNVKGMFLMSQAFAPLLRDSKGSILNIVSNAAHIPMRCSAAYNASKGAALILSKQLARELSPDVTVFSISPNKLGGTKMSEQIDRQVMATRGWTLEKAQEYQLTGLLTGEETPVEMLAEFICFLLSTKDRHKYLTGCDIPYGA